MKATVISIIIVLTMFSGGDKAVSVQDIDVQNDTTVAVCDDGSRSTSLKTYEDYLNYMDEASAEHNEAAQAQAEADIRFWAQYEIADEATRKKLESVLEPTPITEPVEVITATGEVETIKNATIPAEYCEPDGDIAICEPDAG